jgi:hypothetical protein
MRIFRHSTEPLLASPDAIAHTYDGPEGERSAFEAQGYPGLHLAPELTTEEEQPHLPQEAEFEALKGSLRLLGVQEQLTEALLPSYEALLATSIPHIYEYIYSQPERQQAPSLAVHVPCYTNRDFMHYVRAYGEHYDMQKGQKSYKPYMDHKVWDRFTADDHNAGRTELQLSVVINDDRRVDESSTPKEKRGLKYILTNEEIGDSESEAEEECIGLAYRGMSPIERQQAFAREQAAAAAAGLALDYLTATEFITMQATRRQLVDPINKFLLPLLGRHNRTLLPTYRTDGTTKEPVITTDEALILGSKRKDHVSDSYGVRRAIRVEANPSNS